MDWTLNELIDALTVLRSQYGNVPVCIVEQRSDWKLPKNWIYVFSVDAAMSNDNDSHYEMILH